MSTIDTTRAAQIARHNDKLRNGSRLEASRLGTVMITQGVAALGQFTQLDIIKKLQNFNTFTEDNDPHGEHDFGSFEVDGNRIFWKIDYY